MIEKQNNMEECRKEDDNKIYPPFSTDLKENEVPELQSDKAISILNRRTKLINHIKREQFMLTYPNLQPFHNKNHAFESLLPYHLFIKGTTEDILFENTKNNQPSFDVDSIISGIDLVIQETHEKLENGQNIVLDLMDLEAHKYILNKFLIERERVSAGSNIHTKKFVPISEKRRVDRRRNAIIKFKLTEDDFLPYKYVRAVNENLFFKR